MKNTNKKKTIFQRIWSGLKVGWNASMLPNENKN